ncbi:hypothetical protein BV898_20050, partial [Hypsibius exemplaris]
MKSFRSILGLLGLYFVLVGVSPARHGSIGNNGVPLTGSPHNNTGHAPRVSAENSIIPGLPDNDS